MSTDRSKFQFWRTNSQQSWAGLDEMEATYGKYLFMPFDIPNIVFRDRSRFISWFNAISVPVKKIKMDVSSPKVEGVNAFRSVDSLSMGQKSTWETNPHDVCTEFPELTEQLMAYFPFEEMPAFSLWSSRIEIHWHRDQGPWYDLPYAFRIMLHDNNAKSTLRLAECAADEPLSSKVFNLPKLPETNSFAWNNLRVKHSSVPRFPKILMIMNKVIVKPNGLIDLYDRSIAKYADQCFISDRPQTDWYSSPGASTSTHQ